MCVGEASSTKPGVPTDASDRPRQPLGRWPARCFKTRILDATARKLGLPAEKVVVTVDQHANTSAASVPLAFDTAVKDGRIKRGDLVVLEAMGGGFTWGAAALRY